MWYKSAQFNYGRLTQQDISRLNGYIADGIQKGISADEYITRGLSTQDQSNSVFISTLKNRWAAALLASSHRSDPFRPIDNSTGSNLHSMTETQLQNTLKSNYWNNKQPAARTSIPDADKIYNYNQLQETPMNTQLTQTPAPPKEYSELIDPIYFKPDTVLSPGKINYNPPIQWMNKMTSNGTAIIKDKNNWWKIIRRPDIQAKRWQQYSVGSSRIVSPPVPVQTLLIPVPNKGTGVLDEEQIYRANNMRHTADLAARQNEIKRLEWVVSHPEKDKPQAVAHWENERLQWLKGKRNTEPIIPKNVIWQSTQYYQNKALQHQKQYGY